MCIRDRFYIHVERAPSRRHYSDASFTAVGGFCSELKVHWRYDLNPVLSQRLKNETVTRGNDALTVNLFHLCGMVVTAYVTQVKLHDNPETQVEPVLFRGDNVAAESWINRCGGSQNRRASLPILLGRLESRAVGVNAKHILGVQNVVANGIDVEMVQRKDPTKPADTRTRAMERAGYRTVVVSSSRHFENLNFLIEYMDDTIWEAMTRNAEP